jgi:group I intron endonuclease
MNTKISGIYKITNKINDKYYIGSSDNILGTNGRWCEHINGLKANRHENSYLQRSWNKYGSSNFHFTIIEQVPKPNLLIIEQKYLDKAKEDGKQKCYNLSFIASGGWNKGFKHKDSTKRKISEKLKGRISPNKGKKHPNQNFDQKIYTFKNIQTQEIFTGKRYDFCKKFGFCRAAINNLIQKRSKTSYGWIII